MKQVKKIFNILGICFLVIICYTNVVGMGKAETVAADTDNQQSVEKRSNRGWGLISDTEELRKIKPPVVEEGKMWHWYRETTIFDGNVYPTDDTTVGWYFRKSINEAEEIFVYKKDDKYGTAIIWADTKGFYIYDTMLKQVVFGYIFPEENADAWNYGSNSMNNKYFVFSFGYYRPPDEEGVFMVVIDREKRKIVWEEKKHVPTSEGVPSEVVLSPDGSKILACFIGSLKDDSGWIELWDVKTRKKKFLTNLYNAYIMEVGVGNFTYRKGKISIFTGGLQPKKKIFDMEGNLIRVEGVDKK